MAKRIETRQEMLSAEVSSINLVEYGSTNDGGMRYRFMVNGSPFDDAYFMLKPQGNDLYHVELDWPPATGWSSQDLGNHEIANMSPDVITAWARNVLSSLPVRR